MAAAAAAVAASLVALLAANGTSMLDCVCGRLADGSGGDAAGDHLSRGNVSETLIRDILCSTSETYRVLEGCETAQLPPLPAPWGWDWGWDWALGPPPAAIQEASSAAAGLPQTASDEEEACTAALAAAAGLPLGELLRLPCRLLERCVESCPADGLNDTMWNEQTLTNRNVSAPTVARIMRAVQLITKVLFGRIRCVDSQEFSTIAEGANITGREVETRFDAQQEHFSKYWRDATQLLSVGVKHLSHLFIPFAFEYMGNHTNDQQLHGWIKNMERVRKMLDVKFVGWLQDVQSVSKQMVNYKIEKNESTPEGFVIRRPLLSEALLDYQEDLLSFRDDFGALCEHLQPNATKIFGLADALYSFYRRNWVLSLPFPDYNNTIDEEWQLEDQSNIMVSVDTGCLQLLVDAVDRPVCPLEELPAEAARRRQECRRQLWRDLVERPPHIPVTSYLAHTQRAGVSLCLLAWMAANSRSICQDVPFSVIQSVHDARCYFDNRSNQTCLESSDTDAICSIFRAILLLKCQDFFSFKTPKSCRAIIYTSGVYSKTEYITWDKLKIRVIGNQTNSALNYKDNLNSAILRYKDFKVDSLKHLEYSFVALNIIFRFLTAAVFVYLPHLRDFFGKILLAFQITGIVQILCSEVMYRMIGFPSLSVAVLIDNSLTLLSCLWLTTFCYQMYACIRHLRHPNHLAPSEASKMFRRQVLCVVIPWSMVCATCAALENSSKYYLIHSRIILITGISISIAFNLIVLALLTFIYQRTRQSLKQLKISTNGGHFPKIDVLLSLLGKIITLSGIGVLIRIGFHQAAIVAQYVYYVHVASMLKGPLLFVVFVCNRSTLPLLWNRILPTWNPEIMWKERQPCSSAERNLARWRREQLPTAESSL